MSNAYQVDLSYLNDIAGGNVEFVIDMIDIFLEQTPGYFEELGAAIQLQDWKVTGDIAHKIKPTLAFIGAEDLRVKMQQMESNARAQQNLDTIPESFREINGTAEQIYESLQQARAELSAKL
ncbi:HPt (histidine-containing phosphotransfer) domain-containing protein [Arcticibacter pallidicorallinus]|uniref:HPt (Histidine-containing phosphotransfer) domain-containing protein n=1 Tax=Arcticibacter pallidicorallinus TaxID=1259464 RepID=A0A2T0UC28_9SPHI|nr:Hpt domain-containing protein [Arcticibacter pallidicorallinus]PRY55473.1 HPt (histidine-containing phosphotransfer) domain-containing protein [Arcticibacter pallidicorallinus]